MHPVPAVLLCCLREAGGYRPPSPAPTPIEPIWPQRPHLARRCTLGQAQHRAPVRTRPVVLQPDSVVSNSNNVEPPVLRRSQPVLPIVTANEAYSERNERREPGARSVRLHCPTLIPSPEPPSVFDSVWPSRAPADTALASTGGPAPRELGCPEHPTGVRRRSPPAGVRHQSWLPRLEQRGFREPRALSDSSACASWRGRTVRQNRSLNRASASVGCRFLPVLMH